MMANNLECNFCIVFDAALLMSSYNYY